MKNCPDSNIPIIQFRGEEKDTCFQYKEGSQTTLQLLIRLPYEDIISLITEKPNSDKTMTKICDPSFFCGSVG